MTSPEALAAEYADRIEPLDRAANTGWWNANVDSSDAAQQARIAADLALSDALADTAAFAQIRDARHTTGLAPLAERQLVILEQVHTPHQVDPSLRHHLVELETEINARFARHRGTIDGRTVDDNEIARILRTSADSGERRAAWEAAKTVGSEVETDLRELVRTRNAAARALGYRDHFALTLAITDFDETRLFATIDQVDALTAAPFRDLKSALDEQLAARFDLAPDELRPWHYDDPFFQEAPRAAGVDLDPYLHDADLSELTTRSFDRLGLDVRAVMQRSDLLPRDGKNQHAFCIDIDRAGDVRVLSNNTPGERWTETMLHEFGHAVYFEGVDRDLPWGLRTMHHCLTEGVAMRCGRLVHDPAWLERVAGLTPATVADLAPRLRAARRAQLLVFARWVLVMTYFERNLYADPDGDHDTRWWDLVERFQMLRRPQGRRAPDWAAKIHIAVAPVYYHNYLFGEMVASALAATFGDLVDGDGAGHALARRLFSPGATLRWDQLIAAATGAPLTPAVLARDLAG